MTTTTAYNDAIVLCVCVCRVDVDISIRPAYVRRKKKIAHPSCWPVVFAAMCSIRTHQMTSFVVVRRRPSSTIFSSSSWKWIHLQMLQRNGDRLSPKSFHDNNNNNRLNAPGAIPHVSKAFDSSTPGLHRSASSRATPTSHHLWQSEADDGHCARNDDLFDSNEYARWTNENKLKLLPRDAEAYQRRFECNCKMAYFEWNT